MKSKLAFLVGVGVGYLLATEVGRENVEKAKSWARTSWDNPNVQKTVRDVEERVTRIVREQGAQLTGKVSAAVKEASARATGRSDASE